MNAISKDDDNTGDKTDFSTNANTDDSTNANTDDNNNFTLVISRRTKEDNMGLQREHTDSYPTGYFGKGRFINMW